MYRSQTNFWLIVELILVFDPWQAVHEGLRRHLVRADWLLEVLTRDVLTQVQVLTQSGKALKNLA